MACLDSDLPLPFTVDVCLVDWAGPLLPVSTLTHPPTWPHQAELNVYPGLLIGRVVSPGPRCSCGASVLFLGI